MNAVVQHSLIEQAGELWPQATQAEFLCAIERGDLPDEAFNRWLEQDYLFAKGLTAAQAIQASKTPRPAQSILIAGLSAMDAELGWFEAHAESRGIDLNADPHPVCSRYVDFLISSAYEKSFEDLLAILFGVEVSYFAAWSALRAEGPYAEFIDRWSNPHFEDYVNQLGRFARDHQRDSQQELFNTTLRHEHDFWRMTWEG